MNTATGQDPTTAVDGDEGVMNMLEQHVPIALLVDLSNPDGPGSAEILAQEGGPDNRWWESQI
ncbi:MAG: hypothetical protein QOI54_3007 [Actinomycetota bacterium]|jgi:hypothetical protein|nr:hypothetical protein [Actinomycetota bacterium]